MTTVSWEICEGVAFEGKRAVFNKRVNWPSVPVQGDLISCGDWATGWVVRRSFNTDGSTFVEVKSSNLGEEYDAFHDSLIADGFSG